MEPFIFIPLAALASSLLTGSIGMGGGPILIAALLLFMNPAEAIPFHGMVQMVGNLTRWGLLRQHIAWPLVFRFWALMIPGAVVGMWIFQGLSERVIQVLIGVVILGTLFTRELPVFADRDYPKWVFIPLGFFVGILSVVVGVVAMFSSPFMIRKELSKEAINGTMAVFGLLGHITKVVAFGLTGFDIVQALPLFLIVVPVIIFGTFLGKKLLSLLSERVFLLVFKFAMIILSLKLILWEGILRSWV